MMGRLEAEQGLAAISQIAAGTGSMPESDQRRYLADLRRAAADPSQRPQKASLLQLASIGIAVNADEEEVKDDG